MSIVVVRVIAGVIRPVVLSRKFVLISVVIAALVCCA